MGIMISGGPILQLVLMILHTTCEGRFFAEKRNLLRSSQMFYIEKENKEFQGIFKDSTKDPIVHLDFN